MAYWRKYMEAMLEAQAAIIRDQADAIEEAGRVITVSVRRGGVLHMFGSGHSHLAAEEGFYRSGGLAPVSPMLDPSLMFHEGTEKCIALEKWDGYATRFVVPRFELRPEDTLMVFSASGRNNAPIEVAIPNRKRGLYHTGHTSRRYCHAFPSPQPIRKHLADDLAL